LPINFATIFSCFCSAYIFTFEETKVVAYKFSDMLISLSDYTSQSNIVNKKPKFGISREEQFLKRIFKLLLF